MKHIKTFQDLHEKATHVEIEPIKFIPLGRLTKGDEIYLKWDGLSKVKVVSVKDGKYELSRGIGKENKNVLTAKEMSDLYLDPHAKFDGQDVYESEKRKAEKKEADFYDMKPKKEQATSVEKNAKEIYKAIRDAFKDRIVNNEFQSSSFYPDYGSFNFEISDIKLEEDFKVLMEAITPIVEKYGWNGTTTIMYEENGDWNTAVTLAYKLISTGTGTPFGRGSILPSNFEETNEHYNEEYKDMYSQAAEYIGQYGLKDFIGDILPKLLNLAPNKNKDEAYRKLKDIQKML